jgi:hypothetical protein
MASESRKQVAVLGALLALLASVLAWQFWPGGASPAASPAQRAVATRPGKAVTPGPDAEAPEVQLAALEPAPPTPNAGTRNPFRFRAEAAPAGAGESAPRPGTGQVVPLPVEPGPPPGPPPPPPIPYKFVGTLSSPSTGGRVAVLSDGKFVFHGREGDIIEGRYRLVKVGEDSLQIEYADGRGRQTLRMSGS